MTASAGASRVKPNVALGYLRAFVIMLVLAHHSVLVYVTYLPPSAFPFDRSPYLWTAHPVVDSQRWFGFDLLVAFNDVFLMSLMFFISGLFVWPSLRRKGSRAFLRDRLRRLGLPFAVATAFLAPLAYYPSYRVTEADPGLVAFWEHWLSLPYWPSGPVWFVWVLLAFDGVAAALHKPTPGLGNALGRLSTWASRRPLVYLAGLLTASAAAYLPMLLAFGPGDWFHFGPFTAQSSRVLHYAVYFFAGFGIGMHDLEGGPLAASGRLARYWAVWVLVAPVLFLLWGHFGVQLRTAGATPSLGLLLSFGLSFVLSCGASGLCFLALFLRFAKRRVRVFDSLADNSYGMFLIHFIFVVWLQYALLNVSLSAIAKGSTVLIGALALSWITIAAMRGVPAVARVI